MSCSSSAFRRPWSNHHSASLATVCSSLRSYLQISFPHHVLPLLPALAHPCSLIPFLSALVSSICFPSVPLSHPHELQYIISALLHIVMYLCSHSVSPIVSLSLPPCLSVSTFVEQLTFLLNLIPRSAHTGDPVRATEAPTSQQVRAVSCTSALPVAEARRSPGVAWASAWVKRRPVQGAG